jgi:dUTP pyrophosphatase
VLTGDDIERLRIVAPGGRLAEAQLQPNGVDLTLGDVWTLAEAGALGRTDAARRLPERQPVEADERGWFRLAPGAYVVRYAETVALPTDRAGLTFPRSSLLRMGVHLPTAVWDAGYRGRGETLLAVANRHGVALERGARLAQLVVFSLTRGTLGYRGRYQEEGR